MNVVHKPTFHFNTLFYFVYLAYALIILFIMPDRIPTRFDVLGNPIQWADNKMNSMILILAFSTFSFWKLHLFQRFLINDPDSDLLNVPNKKLYLKLPIHEKEEVLHRANRMLGIINSLLLLTFTIIITLTYLSATNPGEISVLITRYSMFILIVIILVFPIAEALALNAMVKQKLREYRLLD